MLQSITWRTRFSIQLGVRIALFISCICRCGTRTVSGLRHLFGPHFECQRKPMNFCKFKTKLIVVELIPSCAPTINIQISFFNFISFPLKLEDLVKMLVNYTLFILKTVNIFQRGQISENLFHSITIIKKNSFKEEVFYSMSTMNYWKEIINYKKIHGIQFLSISYLRSQFNWATHEE